MNEALKTSLDRAVALGIIQADQVDPLATHLQSNRYGETGASAAAPSGLFSDLLQPKDEGPLQPSEESEAPRFVRGFHDVLISIGIVIALTGLAMLISVYALLPASILLCEILVKRQRLALPAVVLTAAFVIPVVWFGIMFVDGIDLAAATSGMVFIYGASAAALVPFYWRYRVPLALAAMILSAVGMVFFLVMDSLDPDAIITGAFSQPSLIVALVFSLVAFAAGMWFDVRDRLRQKRYSDVAFWIHLGAAPALLNSALALVLHSGASSRLWMQNLSTGQALSAVVVTVIFMAVGLIIDRRAFVTAGILSLGYAMSVLFKATGFGTLDMRTENLFGLSAMAVGVTVLALGIGWQPARARLLRLLPQSVQNLVPPPAG